MRNRHSVSPLYSVVFLPRRRDANASSRSWLYASQACQVIFTFKYVKVTPHIFFPTNVAQAQHFRQSSLVHPSTYPKLTAFDSTLISTNASNFITNVKNVPSLPHRRRLSKKTTRGSAAGGYLGRRLPAMRSPCSVKVSAASCLAGQLAAARLDRGHGRWSGRTWLEPQGHGYLQSWDWEYCYYRVGPGQVGMVSWEMACVCCYLTDLGFGCYLFDIFGCG